MDLANAASVPTALAQNADLQFGVTADGATLIYTLSLDPMTAGL